MEGLGPGHHKGMQEAQSAKGFYLCLNSDLRESDQPKYVKNVHDLFHSQASYPWHLPYSSSPHSLHSYSLLFGAVLAPPTHCPLCLHNHFAVLNINITFTHWNPSCSVTNRFINKDQLCSEVTNRTLITNLWLFKILLSLLIHHITYFQNAQR